jgi:hypothetical protein
VRLSKRANPAFTALIALALVMFACASLQPMGDLPSDGTPAEFTGVDDGEYMWTANVTPGQGYEVTVFYLDNPAPDAWILVCEEDSSDGSLGCVKIAEDMAIAGEPSLNFTAPEDGDVGIVVTGAFIGSGGKYQITLAPID